MGTLPRSPSPLQSARIPPMGPARCVRRRLPRWDRDAESAAVGPPSRRGVRALRASSGGWRGRRDAKAEGGPGGVSVHSPWGATHVCRSVCLSAGPSARPELGARRGGGSEGRAGAGSQGGGGAVPPPGRGLHRAGVVGGQPSAAPSRPRCASRGPEMGGLPVRQAPRPLTCTPFPRLV